MGKSYCQVKDIFDMLELSSYHSLLLHLFHFENRLDEIPSVNIISIRNYYIYIYISVLFHKIINNHRSYYYHISLVLSKKKKKKKEKESLSLLSPDISFHF